jgi:hypothetical protein
MKDRITKDKNGQLVTACIVQLADCADFKGCAFNRLCSGLTVSCFESPTDTIHVTVGNKCKKTDDQTDTIVIINNERKDLAF